MTLRNTISLVVKILLTMLVVWYPIKETSAEKTAKSTNEKTSKLELAPAANYSNKRLNEWTWLTAHNAHLNWHDSGVIYMASNQNLSVDQQLRYGVRGFMFDVDFKTCSDLEHMLNVCSCEGK